MQRMRFGTIEYLLIRDGEPVFKPGLTKFLRKIYPNRENRPHPASANEDTQLKVTMIELFEHLRHIRHGLVRSLTVSDGLLLHMDVEEDPGESTGLVPGM
jgi:hypothetical protein